ncbi:MAG: hypothetical protein EPN58_11365 [Rhodanobacter sp.]|nr:MAG: hypothetical protein EPN58_11365 [Rhodanobacter sp.]
MVNRTALVGAMALAWISTAAFAAPKNHPTQPLDFKGLVLGAPATPQQVEDALAIPCGFSFGPGPAKCDDLDKKLQEMRRVKCGEGLPGVQICNGTTTIAGTHATVNLVIGSDGTIQRIHLTLPDIGYDDVHQALVAKFGKPKSVSHPMLQNGFGATFRQEESFWTGAHGAQLLLSQYAGDVENSSLYFSTPADRDRLSGANQAPSTDL